MKLIDRKTRKAIRKGVNKALKSSGMKKALKRHGPEIAAGLAGSLVSTLATLASTTAPGTKGKRSNLARLSDTAADAVTPAKKPKKAASGSPCLRRSGQR
jgi:hypothetical protein